MNMKQKKLNFLMAEHSQVQDLLDSLPPNEKITRRSLEQRLMIILDHIDECENEGIDIQIYNENITKIINTSFRYAEDYYYKNFVSNTPEALRIPGMSGLKFKLFINYLLCTLKNQMEINFLEIGSYHGSTSIAALYNNLPLNYQLIDNYSEFQGDISHLKFNFTKFLSTDPNIINGDCFSSETINKLSKYNIYFYDGPHSYANHYDALFKYIDNLEKTFIYIVDDWNERNVQQATFDAINDLELKINYCNVKLNDAFGGNGDPNGWWNGCAVFLLEKNE